MDSIMIGATPYEEDCAQVGDPDYRAKVRAECNRYIQCLRTVYGNEPPGARLYIKSNPHDFGTYYEVECQYDDTKVEATEYAFKVEAGLATWDQEEPDAA